MTIELSGKTAKVHVSQKVQPEDYEPYEAMTTIEVEIDHTGDLVNDQREELRARLLALQRDAQETVARSCENRLRADGHEDWSTPKREGDGGDGDGDGDADDD